MEKAHVTWMNARKLLVVWSAFQLVVATPKTSAKHLENTKTTSTDLCTSLEKGNLKFAINDTLDDRNFFKNQEQSTDNEIKASAIPYFNISEVVGPELHEGVMRQFEATLQSLETFREEIVNKDAMSVGPLRFVRSAHSPVGKDSVCYITINRLTDLKSGIMNILPLDSTEPSFDINCEFNKDTNDCTELIKLIQCGINHIQKGFFKAMSDSVNSIHEVTKWKNSYDSLSEEYQKLKGDFEKSLPESDKQRLEKSEMELQNLQKTLDNVLELLRDTTVKLCASEIDSGRIDNAVVHFLKLNQPVPNEDVSDIIENAYNYKGQKNIATLLQFIEKLPMFGQRTTAYRKLYDMLRESKDFGCNKASLLLLQAVTDDSKKFPSIDLENKIEDSLPSECLTVRDIVSKINNGKISDAVNDAKRVSRNSVIAEVADIAYDLGKPDNFKNILSFLWELSFFTQRAVAYRKLYDKLKENDAFSCNDASLRLLQAVTGTVRLAKLDNDSEAKSELIDLEKEIKERFPNRCIIKDIASKINNGKIGDAVKDAKAIWHYDLVAEVISVAYEEGKPDDFENIISFIKNLNWYGLKVKCFQRLFSEMKENKDLSHDRLSRLLEEANELGKPWPNDPDAWSWLVDLKKEIRLAIIFS